MRKRLYFLFIPLLFLAAVSIVSAQYGAPASWRAGWAALTGGTDVLPTAYGGTGSASGACPPTSGSSILKGDGSGGTTAATSGTDYAAPVSTGGGPIASSATPTPAVGTAGATVDYVITAQTEAAAFGAPTGTPVNGQILRIRITDDGTARALTWNAAYDEGDELALPTTTVLGKTMYCNFIYNSTATKWQFVGQIGGF